MKRSQTTQLLNQPIQVFLAKNTSTTGSRTHCPQTGPLDRETGPKKLRPAYKEMYFLNDFVDDLEKQRK